MLRCEFCDELAEVPADVEVKSDTTLHHVKCDLAHGLEQKDGRVNSVNIYREIVLADLTDDGCRAVMDAIGGDGVIRPSAGSQ